MYLTAEELKSELKMLDFKQPKRIAFKNLDFLLTSMVEYIGSPDPELRDKLIYTSFFYLIMDDYLTYAQMEKLIKTCLDDHHLFLNISLTTDDSVFTRAFSSLVIALILGKDRDARFLPEDLVIRAIDSSILYLQKEQDLRGYVEEKGWAHSIAHGADLLDEAIKHPLFEMNLAEKCLDAIGDCLFKGTVYIDDEDQRLIFPITALLDRNMSERILEKWIENMSINLSKLRNPKEFSLRFYRTRTSLSNFLKTLYFSMIFNSAGIEVRKAIEVILKKWDRNEF